MLRVAAVMLLVVRAGAFCELLELNTCGGTNAPCVGYGMQSASDYFDNYMDWIDTNGPLCTPDNTDKAWLGCTSMCQSEGSCGNLNNDEPSAFQCYNACMAANGGDGCARAVSIGGFLEISWVEAVAYVWTDNLGNQCTNGWSTASCPPPWNGAHMPNDCGNYPYNCNKPCQESNDNPNEWNANTGSPSWKTPGCMGSRTYYHWKCKTADGSTASSGGWTEDGGVTPKVQAKANAKVYKCDPSAPPPPLGPPPKTPPLAPPPHDGWDVARMVVEPGANLNIIGGGTLNIGDVKPRNVSSPL